MEEERGTKAEGMEGSGDEEKRGTRCRRWDYLARIARAGDERGNARVVNGLRVTLSLNEQRFIDD